MAPVYDADGLIQSISWYITLVGITGTAILVAYI